MDNNPLHNKQEILLRIAEGDEKAFLLLYKHYYTQLKPVVAKYVDSSIETEEILQQTFLKVWLNRDQLQEVENLPGWIYRVAYREYLIALRKRLNYEAKLSRYSAVLSADHNQVLPQEASNLEDIKKNIQEVVSRLSPQRKAIYELSRNEGLKINEIAEKLSIAPQTVKNVLFIVLKMIREHLIASGYGPLTVIIFFKII